MDALNSTSLGTRSNEDIALDLLKFVAATAGVGRPAAPSTGFSGAAAAKPEEHVTQLLDLYGRCLKAVKGKGPEPHREGQGPQPEKVIQSPEPVTKAPEPAVRAPQGWMPHP
jgi:hypothetical protein